MLLLIMTLLYIFITIVLSTILFFRNKYKENNEERIIILSKYLLSLVIYIVIIVIASFIFNNDVKYVDKYCNPAKICKNYTNDSYNLIIGLILYISSTFMFYISTKKAIIKLFNNKFKYFILITYTFIQYCGLLFGYFSFYKFLGFVVIDNILINIFRYIAIFIPIIIYPIDMIINKIKRA